MSNKTMIASGKGTAATVADDIKYPARLIEQIRTRQNLTQAIEELELQRKAMDMTIIEGMAALKIEKIDNSEFTASAIAPTVTKKLSIDKLKQRVAADIIEECYEESKRAGYLQVRAKGEKE